MPSNEDTLRALMQYDAIPPAYRGAVYASPIQGEGGRGPQPQEMMNTTGVSPAQAAAMAQASQAQIWRALSRFPPVQPSLPVQGPYGALAARMAGPSPVTMLPGADLPRASVGAPPSSYGFGLGGPVHTTIPGAAATMGMATPEMISSFGNRQPTPLPTGLAPPQRLLQRFGGMPNG